MIEYDKFQKTLKHLELQYANFQNLDRTLPELLQEAVAESVIQRFETTYDCMRKLLKRYLTEEMGIPDSPKPVFRIASENGLLSSDIGDWLKYADARVSTAHGYSGEKAQDCLDLMGPFIDDAIGLYQTMTKETWE